MFDTHAGARALTSPKLTSKEAGAITDAVRQPAEYGENVMPDMLRAVLTWRVVAALRLVA